MHIHTYENMNILDRGRLFSYHNIIPEMATGKSKNIIILFDINDLDGLIRLQDINETLWNVMHHKKMKLSVERVSDSAE